MESENSDLRGRSPRKSLFSGPPFRWGVGLFLSGLSLYLVFRDITLREVVDAFAGADGRYLALAGVSVVVNNLSKAWRWQALIEPGGKPVGVWTLLMSHLSGQMINTIYPGRLGELSRAYVVGGLGPGRAFVLGTLLLEKLFDLTFYALLFILLLLVIPAPDWLGGSATGTVILAGLLFLVVLFLFLIRERLVSFMGRILHQLPARPRDWLMAHLQRGLDSLAIVKRQPILLRATLWSGVVWVTALLNIYLVLLALRTRLPVGASLLLLVALLAGISIPVPAKFGLFSYICVLSLAVFGVDQATAFSCSLLLQGMVTLPIIVFGLLSSWALGVAKKQPPAPAP